MVPAVPSSSRLVGRHEERARVHAVVTGADPGDGRVVFVRGEAGIGKTCLVTDIAEEAKSDGKLVLAGRCIDLAGPGIPYLALSTAFAPVLDAHPELARLSSEIDRPDDLQSARLRLWREMRSALDDVASTQDVVLLIEDLHWADTSTLDAVAYLAHTMSNPAVTIVATYRTDDQSGPSAQAIADRVAELSRARTATVVDLGPLSDDDIRALINRAAPCTLPEATLDQIVTRCGGNPFFAEELVIAAATGATTLPDLIRHALLSRITGLSGDAREVLDAVAAAGRPVTYDVIAAITELPDHRLHKALRECADTTILVDDAHTYHFGHALQAEAVASTLLPGRREALHRRTARTFEQARHDDGLDISAAELAEQWARAGEPAAALASSVIAAHEAESAAGLVEALRHLERAISLWAAVDDAERYAGTDHPSLLTWAAELADLTGSGRRAAQLVRDAIEHLGPDVSPARVGELHERLGTYLLPIGDRQAGLAAFRQAVLAVPDDPPSPARAKALAGLGTALMLSYRHADSREVCESAVAVAEKVGDEATAARAKAVLGLDLCYLGDPSAGREVLAGAQRLATSSGTPREVTQSDVLLCDLLVVSGQFDDALKVARDGLTYARHAGLSRGYGLVLAGYAAEAHLELGAWDEAGDLLAAVLRDDAAYWSHFPHLLRAELLLLRGDFDGAHRHIQAGRRAAGEPTSSIRYARTAAELAIWMGRPDHALDTIGALDPVPAWHAPRLAAVAMRAAADAAANRDAATRSAPRTSPPRAARRLLAQTVTEMPRLGFLGDLAEAWLLLARAEQSRMAGADSMNTGDPAAWDAAHSAWTGRRHPYLVAYCAWRWAEAELVANAPASTAAVTERVRAAATSAAGLGAQPLLDQVRMLARRARLDLVGLQPDHARALAESLGLTPREGEVLALVANGRTNRHIAEELGITAKTASVHVTHVLRKLGVGRRADAAAIAQRVGPDGRQDGSRSDPTVRNIGAFPPGPR